MEDRLEPLRLFDLDLHQPVKSQIETPKCQSQIETPPQLPENETAEPEAEDSAHQLRVIAEEATMVVNAHDRLEAAIEAARRAGVSWRQIGIAAGVPTRPFTAAIGKEEEHDFTSSIRSDPKAAIRTMAGPLSRWIRR